MEDHDGLCTTLDEITSSLASTRQAIQSLREKQDLDVSDGISLLSLKSHTLLFYIHALTLLTASRALPSPSSSLASHDPPSLPFSAPDRPKRGAQPGDLVDMCVEGRVVLEKIKTMEARLAYQIEKLVRIAKEPEPQEGGATDAADDPLAFRPNPKNLMNPADGDDDNSDREGPVGPEDTGDGIYRPPRLAPMPYTSTTSGPHKKSQRTPHAPSTALANLLHADPTRPHLESSTGLGSAPSMRSSRARAVQRYNEFEEENFTRLVMKKKDMKRRVRDEEDLALGADLSGKGEGRRRKGGFEGEFDDVLRDVAREGGRRGGDGYEELRNKAKKKDVLGRSRVRSRDEAFEDGDGGDNVGGARDKKKGRFQKETKIVKRKMAKSRR